MSSSDPILSGTEKEYAWDAWQKAFGISFGGGSILPDHEKFVAWWEVTGSRVAWLSKRELMQSAWQAGVYDRLEQSTAGFNAWWQEILDTQPVAT